MCTSGNVLQTGKDYFNMIKTEMLEKKKSPPTQPTNFNSVCYTNATNNCFLPYAAMLRFCLSMEDLVVSVLF